MVTRGLARLSAVGSFLAQPGSLEAQETEQLPVEVLKAQGMLALCGILIAGLGLVIVIRLYTHSLHRRWREPNRPSRMTPRNWQAWRKIPRYDLHPVEPLSDTEETDSTSP